MDNNKNLSEFAGKAKEQMGQVIEEKGYIESIIRTLGPKSCLESLKKIMNSDRAIAAVRGVVRGVNLGHIGIQNPEEIKNRKSEFSQER